MNKYTQSIVSKTQYKLNQQKISLSVYSNNYHQYYCSSQRPGQFVDIFTEYVVISENSLPMIWLLWGDDDDDEFNFVVCLKFNREIWKLYFIHFSVINELIHFIPSLFASDTVFHSKSCIIVIVSEGFGMV